ncbi:MAG: PhzF family phenazine biosynthesis protein [Lachnospiraceae bacterium]|nr:PhzF family phenazine biosynthesis protein [Lachnospiraceae bacterium]
MKYYVVDAFAEERFHGNPAGVCVLEESMSKELMQQIAIEHNLPETAFLYKCGDYYKLRWFTPCFEIDLCGHATLAAAFVVFQFLEPEVEHVYFDTISGVLAVTKKEGLYEMAFPKRIPEMMPLTDSVAASIIETLDVVPVALYEDRDLYVVLENEQAVINYQPDYNQLKKLDKWLGIVLTAAGSESDFVSRYFCPELVAEDPVTGSSHSSLIPLWSEKLGKEKMVAKQLSERGGTLYCELGDNDVLIAGKAVLYMQGEIV